MKFLVTLFIAAFSFSASAQTQQVVKPKLSPLTRHYLQEVNSGKNYILPGYVYRELIDGNTYISALIKVADAATAQQNIEAIGAKVGTKAGNIWTVQVPADKAVIFTTLTGISYIQLDEPLKPHLDVARVDTRVDSVQAGYNLPMPYSGKDVVMGMIDFGYDFTNPAFYDTLGANYRIKKVWEMENNGTPPNGYLYGNEITDTNAIKAAGTDNSLQFHGTCTASIAAGSGFGGDSTNRKYRGIAYNSDIIMVGVRRDSIGGQWEQGSFTDFIDGLNYIFNYASSVSKPAVVNISWGSQTGSHDGTSLFNQACDNLSGPGKIIVMSAGNEGSEYLHLNKTFSGTDTAVNTFLKFTSDVYKRTWVDIWGNDTGKTFCANITLYHNGIAGNSTGYICIDDAIHNTYLLGANGTDTCHLQFITSLAEQNDKPRMIIDVLDDATDSVAISVKASEGNIDMWNEYYYYGYTYGYQCSFTSLGKTGFTLGNTNTTVSDMGSARSVLLVGAYTSKSSFTDIAGSTQNYAPNFPADHLTAFSSHGPMIDGRIKPDITAPGLFVITAVSSFDTTYTATGSNSLYVTNKYTAPNGKSYYYTAFDGTSASAPVASGIVALMLQANPQLTPQEVNDYIAQSAIVDNYTTALPAAGNNKWGHGKINAYGAMRNIVHDLSVYTVSGKALDCILFPNPNYGRFTLDYIGNKKEKVLISIYNIAGSLISIKEWNVNAGTNQTSIDLSRLAKGTYIVRLATNEGYTDIKTLVN